MHAPKLKPTANKKSPVAQKSRDRQNLAQRNPLVQQVSQMGNAPNPSAHAAILNRAPANQQSSNQQLLLQLQRQYGNGYVNRVLQLSQQNRGQGATTSTQKPVVQAKLTVNPAGDKYEQEADRVADNVVQRMNAPAADVSAGGGTIQRQEMPSQEDEEEKVAQTKPEISTLQRQEITSLQRQEMTPEPEEEEETAQTKPEINSLQRQEMTPEPDEEEETAQTQPEINSLQRQEMTPEPDEEEDKTAQTKPEIPSLQRQEMTPEPDEEEETAQTKPEIPSLQRQEMTPEPDEEEETAQTKPQSNDKKQQLIKEEDKKGKIAQKQRQSNAKKQQAMTKEEEKVEKIAQKKRQTNNKKEQLMKKEEEKKEKIAQKKRQSNAKKQQAMPKEQEKDETIPEQQSHQKGKEEEDKLVQMKSAKPSPAKKTATADLEASVQKERGRGQPINDNIRGQLEQGFGADFSGVRVHTDSKSNQLNQSIQARAFTTGQDIFFRQGAYDTSSKQGQQLLAHELTHVVQQSGGAVQAKSEVNRAPKNNKIQPKACNCTSCANPQVIQRKETPDQKNEPEQQPEPIKPNQKASAGAGEGQPQPPTDNSTAANQLSSAVGGAAAFTPSPEMGRSFKEGTTGGQQNALVSPGSAPVSADEPSQIIEQLKNTPPTKAAAAYNQTQSASAKALDNLRQKQQDSVPEIPAPTGLSAKEEGKSGESSSKSKSQKSSKSGEKKSKSKPKNIFDLLAKISNKNNKDNKEKKDKDKEQGNSELEIPSQPQNSGNKSDIDNVKTDAGKRPKVDMSGEADPSQIDDEQAKSDEEVQKTKNKEAEAIGEDFGENDIFPDADDEILKAKKEISYLEFPAEEQAQIPEIPSEVIAGLDEGLTPHYQEQVTPEQEKYLQGKQRFDTESEKAKQDSDRQIEEENERAKQEQINQQQETQKEIEKLRGDWQSELDSKEKEYQKKAGKASDEQRKKIDAKKAEGEKQVDDKIKEAEKQAEEKKEESQKEANEAERKRKEREEERNSRDSLGDHLIGAFKDIGNAFEDAWNWFTDLIKNIFNALIDAINKIFEAVKELVNGIIDLVRDAIIELIEAFGEILKGIVKVVFAAFPEISKKFTDAIDGAVKKATEVVNTIADGLKKAVSAILDFFAEIRTTLLGVLRDVFVGVRNLIGMIITGQIGEIIEGFGRVIEAAKIMPDVFTIAAQEELLGGDELNLHEPLSPEELAQAQEAGIDIPSGEGESTMQPGEAGEMPSPPWTQDNVGVDAVEDNMELSPEITEELMQQTGGQGEVMLAESEDESRSMDAIMSETTGKQQAGGEQEQQQVPDDGLTPQQRADIKWQLMWEGIKQWFSDNWPILLAGLIAATAVIVAAIVASGGAVLAAIPPLLKVLAIVFAAEAIATITAHLRDYLTKAWEGDIQGGAKSLAKALALGAIELVMMLTFGVGKAVKAVGKGAKTAAKGAGKVARKVGRGVAKGAKYAIKKGRVVLKGVAGTGIGKKSKSLNELGENILKQTRFKKANIKVSENGKFEVKACINPCNNIATGTTQGTSGSAQGTSRGTKQPAPGGTQQTQPPAKITKSKFEASVPNQTQVFVRTPDGRSIQQLKFTPETKVSDWKTQLGLENADGYFIHGGKVLDNNARVADYPRIGKDSHIEFRLRGRGGGGDSEKLARARFNKKSPAARQNLDYRTWKQGREAQHLIPSAVANKLGIPKSFTNSADNGIMIAAGNRHLSHPSMKNPIVRKPNKMKNKRPGHIKKGIAHNRYNKNVEKFIKKIFPNAGLKLWKQYQLKKIVNTLRKAHKEQDTNGNSKFKFVDDITEQDMNRLYRK